MSGSDTHRPSLGAFATNIEMAFLRRWWVVRPGDPTWRRRKCWTFRGARRIALRTRGTRIYRPWRYSFASVRSGWSESANGYIRRCAFCGYPDEPPIGHCSECWRDEETLARETGFIPDERWPQ